MGPRKSDIVVVGAGAGGGFAAQKLAQEGFSVTLLERGPWFDFTDFPTRHRDWETRRNPMRVAGFLQDPTILYSQGAEIPDKNASLCSRRKFDTLEIRKRRSAFLYHRVFGVGGSTLHYEGEAHRFPRHGFTPFTTLGGGIDWPLEYDELAPWYQAAEQQLGVAGDHHNRFKASRETYPTPPHPLSGRSQWVKRGADRLGWDLFSNPVALPSQDFNGRPRCQHSGVCNRGCPFGAKSSVDRAVLSNTSKNENLTIIDNARVINLESDIKGRINGVVYVKDGVNHVVHADRYLLAAGAIETPRLLLYSEGAKHPNGIGNAYDLVGRHLMETMFISMEIESDRPIEAWKGPPLDTRIWNFNKPGKDQGINGFTLSTSGSLSGYHGPGSYANRIPGFGRAHKQAMRDRFGRIVNIVAVGDHTPHRDNRLTMSKKLDQQGVPKVLIRSDYQARDLQTLRVMLASLEQLADACEPLAKYGIFSTYSDPATTHIGGTCIMGIDPELSVTNQFGQIHGVENLFVTDGSVLPGQGMGDSPSLTIQALALRTAAFIAKNQ